VTPLGGARYQIADGTRTRLAYAATEPSQTWVFLDGAVHLIPTELATTARRAAATSDDVALASPMPATVVEVKITPGQRVTAGDVMIMLEAMKMELPIKAPRDATVKSVACRAGELVQPGVRLLELE
jgi:biotin carboxyl carrier protein